MRDFFVELGRTKVFAEAYTNVRRKRKPAENDAQRKKSHFWMETRLVPPLTIPFLPRLMVAKILNMIRRRRRFRMLCR
jgi:hypothetical protein